MSFFALPARLACLASLPLLSSPSAFADNATYGPFFSAFRHRALAHLALPCPSGIVALAPCQALSLTRALPCLPSPCLAPSLAIIDIIGLALLVACFALPALPCLLLPCLLVFPCLACLHALPCFRPCCLLLATSNSGPSACPPVHRCPCLALLQARLAFLPCPGLPCPLPVSACLAFTDLAKPAMAFTFLPIIFRQTISVVSPSSLVVLRALALLALPCLAIIVITPSSSLGQRPCLAIWLVACHT